MPEANILGAVSAVVFAGVAVWVALVRLKVKASWALSEAERDALMGEEPEAPALASAGPSEAPAAAAPSNPPASGEAASVPADGELKSKAE